MAAFLALRKCPNGPTIQPLKSRRKDAGQLIDLIRDAVNKKRNNPVQIKAYVKGLNGDREEHDFALQQLYDSGGQVVPYIIDELQSGPPEQRPALLDALRRLGPDTLPPLYAVLDSDIAPLQLDILEILRKRAADGAVPYLWRLTAEGTPAAVRQKATRMLADFLDMPASDLPLAKVALTRLAERYYQHKVLFSAPMRSAYGAGTAAKITGAAAGLARKSLPRIKRKSIMAHGSLKRRWPRPWLYACSDCPAELGSGKGAVLAGGLPGKETPAVKEAAFHRQSRSDNGGIESRLGRPAA